MTYEVVFAGNPGTLTGPGNNTYLLDGAEPTLIDAGVGLPEHIEAVARRLGGRTLMRVLVTHGHADHASGVPALKARWPGVEACKWLAAPEPGWRAVADRKRVRAGDAELEAIHTPGHAADHLCFWERHTRDLFCGDLMTAETTILVPPASRGGNLGAYLDSLRRIAALEPARVLPGHGAAIMRPDARIAEYLAHRQRREAQVLACLADGVADLDAIVARVYAETPLALWPAARLTVEAQLEKLRDDGLFDNGNT